MATKCVNTSLPLFRNLSTWLSSVERAKSAVIAYSKFRGSSDYIIPTIQEYSTFLEVQANRIGKDVIDYLDNNTPTINGLLEVSKKLLHKWEPEYKRTGNLVITKGVEFNPDLSEQAKNRIQQVNLKVARQLETKYPEYFEVNKGLGNYYTLTVNFPELKKTLPSLPIKDIGTGFEYGGEIFNTYEEALKEFNTDYPQYEWLNTEQKTMLLYNIDKNLIGSIC